MHWLDDGTFDGFLRDEEASSLLIFNFEFTIYDLCILFPKIEDIIFEKSQVFSFFRKHYLSFGIEAIERFHEPAYVRIYVLLYYYCWLLRDHV